jgi:Flp pilus assembly protein TadG
MIVRNVGGRRAVKFARSRSRGAVAVELALTLCFVIIPMLLGIWEIGCLLDAQQTLVEAVREGGRQAATGTMTDSQVQQVVLQYLSNAGVNTSNVTVTVTDTNGGDVSNAQQLDPLVVTATLPFINVDWSKTGQYVSDSRILTATCQWYSNKDAPYTVSSTAPIQ